MAALTSCSSAKKQGESKVEDRPDGWGGYDTEAPFCSRPFTSHVNPDCDERSGSQVLVETKLGIKLD